MTADEMFDLLGYDKNKDGNTGVRYEHREKDLMICFRFSPIRYYAQDGYDPMYMDYITHKAIHKKMEEIRKINEEGIA